MANLHLSDSAFNTLDNDCDFSIFEDLAESEDFGCAINEIDDVIDPEDIEVVSATPEVAIVNKPENTIKIKKGPGRKSGQKTKCGKCLEFGHYAKTCGRPKLEKKKGDRKDYQCGVCNAAGHNARTCLSK